MIIFLFHHALECLHLDFFYGLLSVRLSLWSGIEIHGHKTEFIHFGGWLDRYDLVVGWSVAHMINQDRIYKSYNT